MPQEDPVLRSARREMIVTFLIFLAALSYTVGYCYFHGYNRDPKSLTFVLGFPDWVFWGVVAPWGVCVIVSWIFGSVLFRDEDLGEERPEEADHV